MLKNRLIAVIIVRDGRVVQSVKFKHTNVIHSDAFHAVESFSRWSVDEIVLLNVSREESSKDEFLRIVSHVSETCFVPLSVGGWLDEYQYAANIIKTGADKLVLNSAFLSNKVLVKKLVDRFGSQCIVASIDSKLDEDSKQTVYVDRGRQDTGIAPIDWARMAVDLGAGEIFYNSIDHDGARKGYDLETIAQLHNELEVPIIAFGGVFTWEHMIQGIQAGADAVAAANIFHYKEQSTKLAKKALKKSGIPVRSEGI